MTTRFQHDDRVKFNSNEPYVNFNTDGYSYINKKAAEVIGIRHLDLISICRDEDDKFYLVRDVVGITCRHKKGCMYFCDVKAVKWLFKNLGISGTRAYFRLSDGKLTQNIDGIDLPAMFIIPTAYNVK